MKQIESGAKCMQGLIIRHGSTSVRVAPRKKEPAKFIIEPITGDNWRPDMPKGHRYLLRYNRHPRFGWLCCHTFKYHAEAVRFSKAQPVQEPA